MSHYSVISIKEIRDGLIITYDDEIFYYHLHKFHNMDNLNKNHYSNLINLLKENFANEMYKTRFAEVYYNIIDNKKIISSLKLSNYLTYSNYRSNIYKNEINDNSILKNYDQKVLEIIKNNRQNVLSYLSNNKEKSVEKGIEKEKEKNETRNKIQEDIMRKEEETKKENKKGADTNNNIGSIKDIKKVDISNINLNENIDFENVNRNEDEDEGIDENRNKAAKDYINDVYNSVIYNNVYDNISLSDKDIQKIKKIDFLSSYILGAELDEREKQDFSQGFPSMSGVENTIGENKKKESNNKNNQDDRNDNVKSDISGGNDIIYATVFAKRKNKEDNIEKRKIFLKTTQTQEEKQQEKEEKKQKKKRGRVKKENKINKIIIDEINQIQVLKNKSNILTDTQDTQKVYKKRGRKKKIKLDNNKFDNNEIITKTTVSYTNKDININEDINKDKNIENNNSNINNTKEEKENVKIKKILLDNNKYEIEINKNINNTNINSFEIYSIIDNISIEILSYFNLSNKLENVFYLKNKFLELILYFLLNIKK